MYMRLAIRHRKAASDTEPCEITTATTSGNQSRTSRLTLNTDPSRNDTIHRRRPGMFRLNDHTAYNTVVTSAVRSAAMMRSVGLCTLRAGWRAAGMLTGPPPGTALRGALPFSGGTGRPRGKGEKRWGGGPGGRGVAPREPGLSRVAADVPSAAQPPSPPHCIPGAAGPGHRASG